MKLLKLLFLFLWQLPQNIIGTICSIKAETYRSLFTKDNELIVVYFKPWFRSAVSLGDTVIMDSLLWDQPFYKFDKCLNHEHGHQIQSRILGPLYLILIGIPSLLGNIVFRLFKINSRYYYKLPWEWWADKLGGVER